MKSWNLAFFALVSLISFSAPASAAVSLTNPAPGQGFGKVRINSAAAQTFTFSNTGTTSQTLGAAAIDANLATCAALGCPSVSVQDFTLSAGKDECSGKTLAPAQSCTIQAEFAPQHGGPRIARLAMSISQGGEAETMLSGTGLYQPADCLFEWAEKTFPQRYPGPSNSFYAGPYYARCYNSQVSCIGVDGVYPSFAAARGYISENGNIQSAGALQDLAKAAGCE